jgi:hypothetical protein
MGFTQCIPHSIQDETFQVFDLLLHLLRDALNEKLMSACIMGLIDQYTVKSKSQKESKKNFIKIIIQEHPKRELDYFRTALHICLVDNIEPVMEHLK